MKSITTFNNCIECDECITNPICAQCLAEKMRAMVGEQSPELAKNIHGIHLDGATQCILCKRGMALCAHCFTKDIHEYLAENDEDLAKEFLGRFDFELRKALVDFC